MGINLHGKSFLKLLDLTSEEIRYLLQLSKDLKSLKRANIIHDRLKGKNIVLLFEKTSTRTRCAFEVAGNDLGLGVTYLDAASSQMGKKESVKDTARVLGRMYDGIEYRGYKQDIVEDLAKYSKVPVWNGLTDEFHPTQMIADFLTIEEHFGYSKGLNFVYMGDARFNMGNSLMVMCAKMGVNFTACAPKEFFPNKELVDTCKDIAKENNCVITLSEDVKESTKNADIIYTDIWVSMGESEKVWEERINKLMPYQVNKALMDNAKNSAIFMHCLPSYHDLDTTTGKKVCEKFNLTELEVTDEVFEGKQSLVFEEAENRLHSIKAIIMATL